MLHIVYSEQIYRILKYADKKKARHPFILLGNDADNRKEALRAYGLRELNLYEPAEKEKIDNEREYISTISTLNSEYASVEWWAHSVSEKNEHLSSHYKNIVFFYCLVETLKRAHDLTAHVFVIGNNEIFQQLKAYCGKNSIKIESLENCFIIHIRQLFSKCHFFIGVLMLCVRTAVKKLYVYYKLGAVIKKEIGDNKDYYIIRTQLNSSFLTKEGHLTDMLFGNLPYHALQRGYKVLILTRIPDACYSKIVRKIKGTKNILIIPEDYFLDYSDLWRLLRHLHFKRRKFSKKIVFGYSKLDMIKIYEEELNRGYFTIDFLINILAYFIARNFSKRLKF